MLVTDSRNSSHIYSLPNSDVAYWVNTGPLNISETFLVYRAAILVVLGQSAGKGINLTLNYSNRYYLEYVSVG